LLIVCNNYLFYPLQALVPITEEVSVPYDFHRFIIGQKGRDVRKMMEDFDVNIAIPPADDHSDLVKITGPPAHVENAKEALAEKVKQLEGEQADRVSVANNFNSGDMCQCLIFRYTLLKLKFFDNHKMI
jgi:polyribonucleotide nucleotidyltransferase